MAFNQTTTTDQVLEGIDLSGKRILVTGVSAGLGVETARALVAHGADVVGTARNRAKAENATAHVNKAARRSGGSFSIIDMELASLASVRQAADGLVADGRLFDVVINNAGVMMTPFGRTEDGFETQFGINHLGHFVFANRIASLIRSGGRLVVLSSSGHRFGELNLDDPNFERTPYDSHAAYGAAKTANALFAIEFDRRYRDRGIRALSVHPGGIQTELGRYFTPELRERQAQRVKDIMAREAELGREGFRFKTLEEGAATSVWAAIVAPASDIGGRYCEDCHVSEIIDDPAELRLGVRSYAQDPELARALWTLSEKLVGEVFGG